MVSQINSSGESRDWHEASWVVFRFSSRRWRCKLALSISFWSSWLAVDETLFSIVLLLRLLAALSWSPDLFCRLSLESFSFVECASELKLDKSCGFWWGWLSFTRQLIFSSWFFFSLTPTFSCIRDNLTSFRGASRLSGPFSVAGGKRDLRSKLSWPCALKGSVFSCKSISLPKVLFILLSNSLPPGVPIECLFHRCCSLSVDVGQYIFLRVCACLESSPLPGAACSPCDLSSLTRDSWSLDSSWDLIAVNWQHRPYGGKTDDSLLLCLPSVEDEKLNGLVTGCFCWLVPRFFDGKKDWGRENLLWGSLTWEVGMVVFD